MGAQDIKYLETKIFFIILSLSFIIILFFFNGTVDDFAPKHVALIHETSVRGYLIEYAKTLFPGFILLGTILILVTEIPTDALIYCPIQWLPFYILFFLVLYKLSDSYILSSLLTFNEVISGSTGTINNYFWPHGFGAILFYLCIASLINTKNINSIEYNNRSEYKVIIILGSASLVYMSYNALFKLLLILSILAFIYIICYVIQSREYPIVFERKQNCYKLFRSLIMFSFLVLVIELGLFNFVYGSFLPTLENTIDSELTGIDKFILPFIKLDNVPDYISSLYVIKPMEIFYLGVLKQLILSMSIVIFYLLIFKRFYRRDHGFNHVDLLLISITTSFLIYAFVRFLIAGLSALMAYPGLLCLVWTYRFSNRLKKWVIFATIALLIITISTHYQLDNSKVRNVDKNAFTYLDRPAYWIYEYLDKYPIFSDELTKNMIYLKLCMEKDYYFGRYIEEIKILGLDGALFIVNAEQLVYDGKYDANYFMLNNNNNYLSIQKWRYLRPWWHFGNTIENNKRIYKIYTTSSIDIFYCDT